MKTIVLVGAGHAHLHVIKAWQKEPLPGCRLVVISASKYQYYSGMFSGYAEGLYSEEQTRVSLVPFCRIAGALFYEDTIERLDSSVKTLFGKSGTSYSYDIVSFDIGSTIAIPEAFQDMSPKVKPSHEMMNTISNIRSTVHPVLIGGGAAAVEMALSIQHWRMKNGFKTPVQLVSASPLLKDTGAESKIQNEMKQAGILVSIEDEVLRMENDAVHTKNGNVLKASALFWLTGASSFPIFLASGLSTTDGFLNVTSTLQSTDEPTIFAAGDCAHFTASKTSLAKNGVHAVKQGPVLWYNLQALIGNQKLRSYEPKSPQLSILSIGKREGLLLYGNWHFKGRLAWRIKHQIDTRFMNKYK